VIHTASRRGVLAGGLATLAASPAGAHASADAELRATLDGLGPSPDPVAGSRALARFDPRRLSPCARIDLVTIRAGLAAEAQLALVAPGDPARYAAQIARQCVGPVDLRHAERLLIEEVARLEHHAAIVFDSLGLAPGSTGQRFRALLASRNGAYPDSDAGRDAAVAVMNATLAQARAALPRWFSALPPECRDVSARRMTPSEVASGKGGFRVLPDNGQPGSYVVDLRDIARRPRWTLVSVVHHELLPGHMVQLPLERRARPHPLRLRYAPAFGECWAIHGEWLAWQAGLLPDAVAVAGAIHWRLFRMTRALADLAINRGTAPDRVVALLADRIGFPAYFAPFADDVARMRTTPGLRVAEALGALAFARYGALAHDVRAFNQTMLECGPRRII
jgi:uncharacterized protein (DUF885 family)